MIMIKKGSILLLTLFGVALLTSCSKGKIETVDKSIDYQNARSIPPLKHPDHSNDVPENLDQSLQTITLEQPQVANPNAVKAAIIKDKEGLPLLLVNSEYEQAWQYLDNQLKQKNITVYNRNKEAGLFSIGCGDIENIPVFEEKSGGWTIFKRRKKTVVREYCTLHVTPARKKSTSAAVMNRYGQVVGGDYVNGLFERIVNN